jgi:hypothetical protein
MVNVYKPIGTDQQKAERHNNTVVWLDEVNLLFQQQLLIPVLGY